MNAFKIKKFEAEEGGKFTDTIDFEDTRELSKKNEEDH